MAIEAVKDYFDKYGRRKDILEFDEWKERELHKIEKGISAHCDPELYSYIDKIPNNALEFVKNCLKTLKIL